MNEKNFVWKLDRSSVTEFGFEGKWTSSFFAALSGGHSRPHTAALIWINSTFQFLNKYESSAQQKCAQTYSYKDEIFMFLYAVHWTVCKGRLHYIFTVNIFAVSILLSVCVCFVKLGEKITDESRAHVRYDSTLRSSVRKRFVFCLILLICEPNKTSVLQLSSIKSKWVETFIFSFSKSCDYDLGFEFRLLLFEMLINS